MTDITGVASAADPGAGTPDASIPPETGATKAWDKASAEIVMLNTPEHQIATVWHPDAIGEVVVTAHGNVRVLRGDRAEYQLTDGEVIAL